MKEKKYVNLYNVCEGYINVKCVPQGQFLFTLKKIGGHFSYWFIDPMG